MNEEFFISKLETLQAQAAAHQAALRVLVLTAPESTREELLRIADGYEEATLALPISENQRQVIAGVLRKLAEPLR